MNRKSTISFLVGLGTATLIFIFLQGICRYEPEQEIQVGERLFLQTELKHTCGLKRYAPVKLRGVSVGKIETLAVEGEPGKDHVRITFSIVADKQKYIAKSNPDLAVKGDGSPDYSYAKVWNEDPAVDPVLDIYPGRPDLVGQVESNGLIRTLDCSR